jgi:hypothetical protein
MFAINSEGQALSETSISPERTANVEKDITSQGRVNVLIFYQSLTNQLTKAEKLQVVCSHIFTQVNWCLNPDATDSQTNAQALRGFLELLKALKYVMNGSTKTGEEPESMPVTPDEQARCLLFYLREIRRILNVQSLFTLNDFLTKNAEVLILHLANIFTCLVRDEQLN